MGGTTIAFSMKMDGFSWNSLHNATAWQLYTVCSVLRSTVLVLTSNFDCLKYCAIVWSGCMESF